MVDLKPMVCEDEDSITDEGGEVVLVAFNKDRLKIMATIFDGVGAATPMWCWCATSTRSTRSATSWTWPPTGAPSCASSPSAKGLRSK
ncbi:unnamed protein product [Ixodes persulcatus]